MRLFEYGGLLPEAHYLLPGGCADRGKQSLEFICLLLAYKITYPKDFFILRGNCECVNIDRIYGFYDKCKRRYNIELRKTFTDCFNCLPIAAIIDEKIFTMHGGLSPDLQSMEQIRRVMRPTDVPDTGRRQWLCFLRIVLMGPRVPLSRPPLRLAMVRSRQGHNWVVRERSWRVVYVRARCGVALPPKTRHGPDLSGAPGG